VGIAEAAGADLLDDGRGLAVVDWDQDGDLDFWISNRTGPAQAEDRPATNRSTARMTQRIPSHCRCFHRASELGRTSFGKYVKI